MYGHDANVIFLKNVNAKLEGRNHKSFSLNNNMLWNGT